MLKRLLIGLAVLVAGFMVWQHELIAYGLTQARGQLKVVIEARSIQDVLDDDNVSDSLETKLKLAVEIRQYAIDHLGINDSETYRSLYDQKGKVTLWNLTACQPFELEAKTWSFPLIGSFPYKGFFDIKKAKMERDRLQALGLDTRIRPVSGWSTLGWFNDPLLSNMLDRPVGQLAELIIHELTHGTLYIKDSADYNENLATFIGERGAERFLINRYGIGSNEYEEYVQSETDYDNYIQHFIRGATALDSLYDSMNKDYGDSIKLSLKEELIQSIVDNIDTISFHNPTRYRTRFANQLPNNAYFLSFLRYHSKQKSFQVEYDENFGSDINSYLTYLKQKYPSL